MLQVFVSCLSLRPARTPYNHVARYCALLGRGRCVMAPSNGGELTVLDLLTIMRLEGKYLYI
jgi:hypothetical protein